MLRWLATMMVMVGLCLSSAPGQAKGRQLRHEVRAGETLSRIALYYSCTVEQLKALNGLKSDSIGLGARLLVPWPDVRLRKAERINVSVHKVLPGESLGVIANRYDADVRAIRLFNGIDGDRIKAGQRIKIPTAGPALKRSVEPYVVQPGDNLLSIAKGHDVQPRQLRHLNGGVDFKALRAGQELKVYKWEVLGAPASAPTQAPPVDDADVDLDLTDDADLDDEATDTPDVTKAKAVQVLKEQTAALGKGGAKPATGTKAAPAAAADRATRAKDKPGCTCTCHQHDQAKAGATGSEPDKDDFAYEE
jgi:LysM repeat protein